MVALAPQLYRGVPHADGLTKVVRSLGVLSKEIGVRSLTMHHMRPASRAVAYIFPGLILALIALSVPGFMETGRILWVGFIFALPLLLSIVICVEYRASAIGFDAKGVRFRSVGYTIDVPWDGVTLETSGNKPILRVARGTLVFFPWLGFMHAVLMLMAPYRARRAEAMMTTIPLHVFVRDGNDPVMGDLRAVAPVGWS